MKKNLLFVLAMAGLVGCAQSDESDFLLKGRIAMKGSAPHSYLVIEDRQTHKNYKIDNAGSFDLAKKQNQVLALKAILVKEAVGPGFPAVIHVTEIEDQ